MNHAERIVSVLLEDGEQTEFPIGMPSSDELAAMSKASAIQYRADLEKENGRQVEEYSVSKHGVMNSSYWQGAGTSYTNWDEAITGTGINAFDALEDAIEQAGSSGWDVRSIENKFNPNAGDVAGQVVADANPGEDVEDHDSYYYVVLYLKGELDLNDPVDPDEAMLKDMADYVSRKELKPGDEAISGTSITSDIIEACLDLLKQLHPSGHAQFLSDYSDELSSLQGGDSVNDEDVEIQNKLMDVLSKYCPPYTYFGFNEGDSSVGCWPNREKIKEDIDEGVLTDIPVNGSAYSKFIRGEFNPGTEYTWVWDADDYCGSLYRSQGGELLWHY